MKYPSEGGYQPGDTWELYVGTDKRIEAIVYHHHGAPKSRTVIATFADYMKAGPLLIATDHRGTDGKPIRIFFSNLWDQTNGSTRKPSEGFIRTADDEAYKSRAGFDGIRTVFDQGIKRDIGARAAERLRASSRGTKPFV